MHAIATSTDIYTVQPFATVPVDGDAADLLDRILDALERDPRALGPVVAYDYERQRVEAIFQVEFDGGEHTTWFTPAGGGNARALVVRRDEMAQAATRIAVGTFDDALRGFNSRITTLGVSIVEGDDPDLLP